MLCARGEVLPECVCVCRYVCTVLDYSILPTTISAVNTIGGICLFRLFLELEVHKQSRIAWIWMFCETCSDRIVASNHNEPE